MITVHILYREIVQIGSLLYNISTNAKNFDIYIFYQTIVNHIF